MKTLIIIRGLPGSGKSTLAKMFDPTGQFTCEADQFMVNKNTGEYEFNPIVLGGCHELCRRKVKQLMEDYKNDHEYQPNIIVSNTGTTEKEIQPYIDLAKAYDYKVISLVVENRHGNKSIHGVPELTMERMKQRFEIQL